MAHAAGGDGRSQPLGDMLLADQLVERLRPIAPRDNNIFSAVGLAVFQSVVIAKQISHSKSSFSLADSCFPIPTPERRRRMRDPPHKEVTAYGCWISPLTRFTALHCGGLSCEAASVS